MQPFNYSVLQNEIRSINDNLQLFSDQNPSIWGRLWRVLAVEPRSLGIIQHFLSENYEHLYFYKPEGVFPYAEARKWLAKPLAELKQHVVKLPDSKEKRLVLAQLQRINEIVTPLPDSEKKLDAIEEELKNANPPLVIKFERDPLGRIIDPNNQLLDLQRDIDLTLAELYTFSQAHNYEWIEYYKINLAIALQIVHYFPFIAFVSECYRNNPSLPSPEQDLFQMKKSFLAAKNYSATLREWFSKQQHAETSLNLSVLQPEVALFSKVTSLTYEGTLLIPCKEVYNLNLKSLTTTSPHFDLSRFKDLENLALRAFWMNPKVPESIYRLDKLQILDLQWFDFNGEIPEELGNLHNLQVLNVAGCLFSQFPESIKTMSNLTTVACSLSDLPKLRSVIDPKSSLLSKIELAIREMTHSGPSVMWEADSGIPLEQFLNDKSLKKPERLL